MSARIGSFFLDSGAFSLYNVHVLKVHKSKDTPAAERYSFYSFKQGSEFRAYLDAYAAFVQKHAGVIDIYANVDAIYNPEITWQAQQYLEKEHGLHPVPVIHFGTKLKWVSHYLERGYDLVGIGGVGTESIDHGNGGYNQWADGVFRLICPGPKYLPLVRTHGFAVTDWKIVTRFPWWSVDSASWVMIAAYGSIVVPRRRGGRADFNSPPYTVSISDPTYKKEKRVKDTAHQIETPHFGLGDPNSGRGRDKKHFTACAGPVRADTMAWLAEIGIPLGGELDSLGRIAKLHDPEKICGVMNHHRPRAMANVLYYQALAESRPPWPHPYEPMRQRGAFTIPWA